MPVPAPRFLLLALVLAPALVLGPGALGCNNSTSSSSLKYWLNGPESAFKVSLDEPQAPF